MRRIKLHIENKSDKVIISVSEDTHYIIRLIGRIVLDSSITFSPSKNGIDIKVSVIGVLTNNSIVKLAIVLEHDDSINSFNYDLNSRIIITDSSTATILPIIKVRSTEVVANHKVVIGSIDNKTLQYFLSKGIDEKGVVKLLKESYSKL